MINSENKRSRLGRSLLAIPLAAVLFAVSACATQQPRITTYASPIEGQSSEQVVEDQIYCEKWAKMQPGTDPTNVGATNKDLENALALAALGAALGGIFGGWRGVAIGTPLGGGLGALLGVTSTRAREEAQRNLNRAYSACMEGKGGYVVR